MRTALLPLSLALASLTLSACSLEGDYPWVSDELTDAQADITRFDDHLELVGSFDVWFYGDDGTSLWIDSMEIVVPYSGEQIAAVSTLSCGESFPVPAVHPTPIHCTFTAESAYTPPDVAGWLEDATFTLQGMLYVSEYDEQTAFGGSICLTYEGEPFGC